VLRSLGLFLCASVCLSSLPLCLLDEEVVSLCALLNNVDDVSFICSVLQFVLNCLYRHDYVSIYRSSWPNVQYIVHDDSVVD